MITTDLFLSRTQELHRNASERTKDADRKQMLASVNEPYPRGPVRTSYILNTGQRCTVCLQRSRCPQLFSQLIPSRMTKRSVVTLILSNRDFELLLFELKCIVSRCYFSFLNLLSVHSQHITEFCFC